MDKTAATKKEVDTAKFSLVRIYLKDASLEAPDSPAALLSKVQLDPKVSLDYRVQLEELSKDTHNVVLTVTVSAANEQKPIFLVEIQQGGVFLITNVNNQERLHKLLNIRCPSILFPYASEAMDNLLIKAGFPPLMLAPLNFRDHYTQIAASHSKDTQSPTQELG